MDFTNINIRYEVNYYKVVNLDTGLEVPNVSWIDDEQGQCGMVDNSAPGKIRILRGNFRIEPSRKQSRRQFERRQDSRRKPERRNDT
jgi:hypothetical protein